MSLIAETLPLLLDESLMVAALLAVRAAAGEALLDSPFLASVFFAISACCAAACCCLREVVAFELLRRLGSAFFFGSARGVSVVFDDEAGSVFLALCEEVEACLDFGFCSEVADWVDLLVDDAGISAGTFLGRAAVFIVIGAGAGVDLFAFVVATWAEADAVAAAADAVAAADAGAVIESLAEGLRRAGVCFTGGGFVVNEYPIDIASSEILRISPSANFSEKLQGSTVIREVESSFALLFG